NTQHTVKFGGQYIFHVFVPSNASAKAGEVNFDVGKILRQQAHDAALYINDEYEINDKWLLNAGLRLTFFQQVGPFDRYVNDPISGVATDTIHYSSGENVKTYTHAEPRIAARYAINHLSSLKASISQNYQYIHLASLSSISLPTDTWIPSSDQIYPQMSWQYALGYFRNLKNNMYESSVEVYYKTMKHQIEYEEGFLPENTV